ncbi:GspH/FimT family pseudopilin [Stenotrophomonas maltophilia]|uniref:GspH/FimT family pseudopilin n=2 Tax=Stenotrophomonas TaxID=40323 RepID=UPI00070C8FBC|nr:type IV fimbrial biogenesis protein [Stenotrophomonas maltophilia]NNH46746.1 prepilin-type cleavage/methylation domain-containing protein [Stenotrophomonas maltophilia]VEE52248.1 fimbrial biogenesis protein [Stenotrophomonas maltophilia]
MSLRHRPARLHRGLHLIEFLIAVMVLAVLLALAWGPWQRMLRHFQAETLRAELVTSLSMARSAAITERRRVTVCGSSDGMTCDQAWRQGWRVQVEPANSATGAGRELRVHRTRQRHVDLRTSDHRPDVRFRPDGRNAGTNQSIALCVDGQEHSRVIISVPGRVRSQRPQRPTAC